jgi:hypothetical protein
LSVVVGIVAHRVSFAYFGADGGICTCFNPPPPALVE